MGPVGNVLPSHCLASNVMRSTSLPMTVFFFRGATLCATVVEAWIELTKPLLLINKINLKVKNGTSHRQKGTARTESCRCRGIEVVRRAVDGHIESHYGRQTTLVAGPAGTAAPLRPERAPAQTS